MLCLAWLPLSYSNAQQLVPGQQYTTQDLVQQTQQNGTSTWTNGVYQSSLTCWGGGDPGYCGPNAIVRPGNNINFSYGTTNLYQLQAIASALPNSGSGLLVNGYNFGFTAKNGNGWDDGRLDYLTAYVSFYDPKGTLAFNKNYDLNYKFNWTTFNYSETFSIPFASKDLGSVQYGFVGRDNNFWAGPYGPEVNNITFSLKYSVDPCVSNPLYAPTCPGYLEAFNKLKPAPLQELITTTTQAPISEPIVATTAAVQPTTSTTVAAVSQPQQTTQKSSAPSIGTILNIISSVQAQTRSVERLVVQQAVQEATKQGEKAQQEAESMVAKQVAQQQEQQQTQQNLQNTSTQQTFLNTARQDIFQLPGNSSQRQNTSLPITTVSNQESFQQNLPAAAVTQVGMQPQIQVQLFTPSISTASNQEPILQRPATVTTQVVQPQTQQPVILAPLVESAQPQQAASIYQLVQPSVAVSAATNTTSVQNTTIISTVAKPDPLPEVNTEQKQVTGPTNILQPFLDQKPTQENVQQTQQTAQVNKSARDSELAGSVTLVTMARQPQGFETYMAILQDVPFYKPTEVYPNQRTVDNQRVQRLLTGASDAKHKELVDSQYRR